MRRFGGLKLPGLVLSLGFALAGEPAAAQTLGPPAVALTGQITLMTGWLDTQMYMPVVLAQRLGYFKDAGLDVRVVAAHAGQNGPQAVLAGQVQGVLENYDRVVEARAEGKPLVDVVQLASAPGVAELVPAQYAGQVHKFADLKGMMLGVATLDSTTYFLTQALAARAGLGPHQMVLLGMGAGAIFLGAVKNGQMAAGMTAEPTLGQALGKQGGVLLVDLRGPKRTRAALGGPYPGACLYMSDAYVAAHPVQVRKLAVALVRALRFIAEHSPAEIAAVLPPEYDEYGIAALTSSIAAQKGGFTRDGVMPAGGPAMVGKVLQKYDLAVRSKALSLAETYTTRFVTAGP